MCEFLKIKPCAVSEAGNAYSECRRREVCNRKIKKDSLEFQPNLSKMSLLYQPDGFILYKRHRRAVKITQTLLPQGENFGSSTVYARSLQKKPMNEKTELKKTGITPIVK